MRTVTEYLLKAVEFDDLATLAPEDALKKRYADLAECYRLLAEERAIDDERHSYSDAIAP